MDTWRIPAGLFAGMAALIAWSAVGPADWRIWWAEITPVLLVLALLAGTARQFRFSTAAYLWMLPWLALHTIGAHYTFAEVPFGWFNDLIGSDRNHFDRVAHFTVGFYAFPLAEWLLRRGLCGLGLALAMGQATVMAIAAGYEVIEWLFAVVEGGDVGIEFLGAQGDVWDAQKDMLADSMGALLALAAFTIQRPDRRAAPSLED